VLDEEADGGLVFLGCALEGGGEEFLARGGEEREGRGEEEEKRAHGCRAVGVDYRKRGVEGEVFAFSPFLELFGSDGMMTFLRR
jgi:hypothetical protein